jgi:polyhydroxyalkanoate synthase subunit PhaC
MLEPFDNATAHGNLAPANSSVIYESGKASVRYYAAQKALCRTPIVVVYALIKRAFILDLQPGNSVVESLTRRGFEVYLIDWLPPTPADSERGFDAYVNHDLANAICAVKDHRGVAQVSVIGYCLGALLSLMYSALHAQDVRNLVTLAAPLDMSIREFPSYLLIDWLSENAIDAIIAANGNCPAWLLESLFAAIASLYRVGNLLGVYPESERDHYARLYPAFRRWLDSEVPIAGRLFRELAVDIFKKNLLCRGRMLVGAETIDLKRISAALLNVVASQDTLVDPKSSLPLIDMVGSQDKTTLMFPVGHVGVVVGLEAHAELWPKIAEWLRQRDCRANFPLEMIKGI